MEKSLPSGMVQIGIHPPQSCVLEEWLPTERVRTSAAYDLIASWPAEWTIRVSGWPEPETRLDDAVPIVFIRRGSPAPPRFGVARVTSVCDGVVELTGLGALASGRGYLDNMMGH